MFLVDNGNTKWVEEKGSINYSTRDNYSYRNGDCDDHEPFSPYFSINASECTNIQENIFISFPLLFPYQLT